MTADVVTSDPTNLKVTEEAIKAMSPLGIIREAGRRNI
jgi:hypothetical protein